jgi:hypothetical protein
MRGVIKFAVMGPSLRNRIVCIREDVLYILLKVQEETINIFN